MSASNTRPDANEFSGKQVLVTGGTKGIGAAIVNRLRGGGATTLATARTIPTEGNPDEFIQADAATRVGADHIIKTTLDRLGRLDILIHNVGGSSAPGGGALVLTDEIWQEEFELNLFSAVRLDRGFLPAMLERGSGVIIHVSSIQRTLPLFEATLGYAAAKAALTNYSKGLSKEVAPRGIRVNQYCAGIHRNRGRQGLDRTAGGASGHRHSSRKTELDERAGRNSAWTPQPPRGSCGIGCVPRLRSGVFDHGKRIRYRRWKYSHRLRSKHVAINKMKLPTPVETYINAINAGDAAALQSSFADDALVKDVGREFRGTAAIKDWAAREIFAVKVTLDVIAAVERDSQTIVTVKIDGTFDRTGLPDPLLMDHCFTVAGEKIATLSCRLAGEAP
jgi:NAD(P)-dependent dehydrogenase (short-subunit alcohol dehydrogenase family)